MAVPVIASDIGASVLPDVGTFSYNGVKWSQLYHSKVNAPPSPDNANRTTKCVDYTIIAEGVVTLNPGEDNTDATWRNLRQKLSVPGGVLIYTGNGFGSLIVNAPGNPVRDVAWGPVSKELDFQSLGSGRAAFIKWEIKTRIPEFKKQSTLTTIPPIASQNPGSVGPSFPGDPGLANAAAANAIDQKFTSVLQYNYEASLTYDEEGYSGYSIRGTVEIPLTRKTIDDRTLADIVTNYRQKWLDIRCDLNNFKIVRRSFEVSRDKRTIEWEFVAEELTNMGLPPFATDADGTFSVRNQKQGGIALVNWMCSLTASYVVRKDQDARGAALMFYALLWFRIQSSRNKGIIPPLNNPNNNLQQPKNWLLPFDPASNEQFDAPRNVIGYYQTLFQRADLGAPAPPKTGQNALIYDFGFDEGLYKSNKRITFHCTWALLGVPWTSILTASGVWRWLQASSGGTEWAISVQDIQGWRSWMTNNLDPTMDVIVDLGGGNPPQARPIE